MDFLKLELPSKCPRLEVYISVWVTLGKSTIPESKFSKIKMFEARIFM